MTIAVPVPVSSFPDATLPLTGAESVPLVQGGVTKKAPSSAFVSSEIRLVPEDFFVLPAGTTNDYNIGGAVRAFFDTAAGDATITGFTGGEDGQILVVTNSGSVNSLTLDVETGSAAANQIYGVTAITLPPHGSQQLCYSGTLLKWVML